MSVEHLLAAATTFEITPRSGLSMSGFLDRSELSRGTTDELEVNMLWVAPPDSGGVLWISLDVLAVTPQLRAAIVEAVGAVSGIDASQIIICASHTHSGPSAWHERIHPVFADQFDRHELRRLAVKIGEHSGGLRTSARPALATWRSGGVHGVGSNRHRVDGPHDPSLGLLEVSDAQTRQTTALLYDYACHPTVLGPDNLFWSADWVSGARAHVRARREANAPALPVLFLQGCAGDASTRFFREERTSGEAQRLGGIVGARIVDLLDHAGDEVLARAVHVDRTSLHLPARTDLEPPASRGGGGRDSGRVSASRSEGARCLLALRDADLPSELALPVSVITIGSRRWMHLPVEMCASYGFEIASGRDDVRVIGYTDDYLGYIADRESFRTGQYEALSSFFDEETSYRVMVECRDYLDSVYETSRS
jgi:hypothetical protein